jgi:hypothetical protein
VKSVVYGDTPQSKQAAMDWLKAIAEDDKNAISAHAKTIQQLLAFYVAKCGDVD